MPGLMQKTKPKGPSNEVERRTLTAARGLARKMAKHGRNGDSLIAHLDPDEAALLKSFGGAGTINPKTGAVEFWPSGGPGEVGGGAGDSATDSNGAGPAGGASSDGGSVTDAEGEMAGAVGPSGRSGAEASAGNQADSQAAESDPSGFGGPGADDSFAGRVASYGGKALGANGFGGTGYGFGGLGTTVGAITAVGDLIGAIAADAGLAVDEPTGIRGGDPNNFGGGDQGNDVGGSTDGVPDQTPEQIAALGAEARTDSYSLPNSDSEVLQRRGLMGGAASRMAAAGRDGDTILAHINPKEAELLQAFGGRGTINPATGALEFAPDLNWINPDTGVSIGFNSQAEKDAWLGSQQSSGYQTQAAATAGGQSIDQIKDAGGKAHNSIGGLGYQTAKIQGQNDPTTDPTNPQAFSSVDGAPAVSDGGTSGLRLYSGSQSWGANPAKNKWISEKTGYAGPYGDDRFNNWAAANGVDVSGLESEWDAMQRQSGPAAPAPSFTEQEDSVETRLGGLLAKDSPLMQRAASQGLATANRRGLLNSSMAAEAAQAAMIDRALPIVSQDASQSFQKNLSNQNFDQDRTLLGDEIASRHFIQARDIEAQFGLQANDIDYKQWATELDATTRLDIANMQVDVSNKEKIGAMVASAQSNYLSAYTNILNNPDMSAEDRTGYLQHIASLTRDQIDLIEEMYGVSLTWSPSVPVAA